MNNNMVPCITQPNLEMTARAERRIKDRRGREEEEWEVGVCDVLPRDQVTVTCEEKSFVSSGCTHHALGWMGGGCMFSRMASSGDFAPANLLLVPGSQHTHTLTHTHSSQRHDPFLCITTDASWRMEKKNVHLQSREGGTAKREHESECEGQMLAWPQGSAWKRWSSVKRSVSRTQVTHEREHCSKKKKKASTLENKLPLLQDNLTRLTVRRWREAERLLHPSEVKRGRGGGGLPSSRSRRQNGQRIRPHTHTHAHTRRSPLLSPPATACKWPRWGKQTRRRTRGTSIPTFYSLLLIGAHPHMPAHALTPTRLSVCHSVDAETGQQKGSQKLSKVFFWRRKKKTQAWAGCAERERGREGGGVSRSSAFLISLPWQPIRGQAAPAAANQKKGLAVSVLL